MGFTAHSRVCFSQCEEMASPSVCAIVSHLFSPRLRTPRPFHLLSHFYPSCNHRDHHCLKRGFLPDRQTDVVVSAQDPGSPCAQQSPPSHPHTLLNRLYETLLLSRKHVLYLRTDMQRQQDAAVSQITCLSQQASKMRRLSFQLDHLQNYA